MLAGREAKRRPSSGGFRASGSRLGTGRYVPGTDSLRPSDYPSEIGYHWNTVGSGALGTPIPAADSWGTTFPVTVTESHVTASTNFKNHGAYVSSVGGGSDAAHSCIGMPIQ